jgi:hypothetical protein
VGQRGRPPGYLVVEGRVEELQTLTRRISMSPRYFGRPELYRHRRFAVPVCGPTCPASLVPSLPSKRRSCRTSVRCGRAWAPAR